jgi:hypothetical protein
MPQQFFPYVFQSHDPSGIWYSDPALAMVLAFILVPIGLAIVWLTIELIGRLLRENPSIQAPRTPSRNRITATQRLQIPARLDWRRHAPRHPKVSRARAFRNSNRRSVRRSKGR